MQRRTAKSRVAGSRIVVQRPVTQRCVVVGCRIRGQGAITNSGVGAAGGRACESKFTDADIVLTARRNNGVAGIEIAHQQVVTGGAVGDGIG